MKRFVLFAAALFASTAYAGNTQVSPSAFKAAGKTGHYHGRSDGVYQEANSKGVYVIENGTSAAPIGAGYRETFAYGAGKGMSQLAWATGLTTVGLTTTVPAIMYFQSGVKLMWASVVTETLFPITIAAGLDITGDLVNLDGLEIFGGILGGSGRPMIVGDDPAFYFCSTLTSNDVSGQTILRVGWRKVEPMNAVFANYNTYATIGPDAGTINISTEDDAGGITTTSTTQSATDAGAAKKYCVNVSGAGVVTYTIDGAAPTVTAAFTIDDGDAVIPFVHFVESADTATDVITMSLWEVGYSE